MESVAPRDADAPEDHQYFMIREEPWTCRLAQLIDATVTAKSDGGKGDTLAPLRARSWNAPLKERSLLIGGLIVTHGRLSYELLSAAQTIEGQLEQVEAVALDWNDSVDEARRKIGEALARVEDSRGVIIFTDMFGGTPSNISISFLEQERVEVVTGVNLPMIVKFGSLRGEQKELAVLAHQIREKGSKSIRVASDLLSKDSREQGNGS